MKSERVLKASKMHYELDLDGATRLLWHAGYAHRYTRMHACMHARCAARCEVDTKLLM